MVARGAVVLHVVPVARTFDEAVTTVATVGAFVAALVELLFVATAVVVALRRSTTWRSDDGCGCLRALIPCIVFEVIGVVVLPAELCDERVTDTAALPPRKPWCSSKDIQKAEVSL